MGTLMNQGMTASHTLKDTETSLPTEPLRVKSLRRELQAQQMCHADSITRGVNHKLRLVNDGNLWFD